MTYITLFWEKERLVGLETRGHSDDSSRKGEDVVCAAVSTLVHALLVGLRDVAKVPELEFERDQSVPLISVRWPEGEGLDLLTRTVALSLREVAAGYAGYISLSEVRRS